MQRRALLLRRALQLVCSVGTERGEQGRQMPRWREPMGKMRADKGQRMRAALVAYLILAMEQLILALSWGAVRAAPSPRAWRPDFPGAAPEAP